MRTEEERAVHAASERKRYSERRSFGINYLGSVCAECGTTNNLQFDHVDSTTKLFDVSVGMRAFKIWFDEIKKCQLLCRPCHIKKTIKNEETAGQKKYGSLRHGTYTMYMKGKCRCDDCRSAYSVWKKEYRSRPTSSGL